MTARRAPPSPGTRVLRSITAGTLDATAGPAAASQRAAAETAAAELELWGPIRRASGCGA